MWPAFVLLVLMSQLAETPGEIAVDRRTICSSTAMFSQEKSFCEWKSENIYTNDKAFRSTLGALGTRSDKLISLGQNMLVELAKVDPESLPDFSESGSWYGAEREDLLLEIEDTAPSQVRSKCKAAKARMISLGEFYNDPLMALKSFRTIAETREITTLVFDSQFNTEGSIDTFSGRPLAYFDDALSQTYALAISATAPYAPAIYDVGGNQFSINNDTVIPKTLCMKPVPSFKLSKEHFNSFLMGYKKFVSVITRFKEYTKLMNQMFASVPRSTQPIHQSRVLGTISTTYEISQLFPSMLTLLDGKFHTSNVGSPLETVDKFISMIESFLAENPIISLSHREFVLKLAMTQIPILVGEDAEASHPFVKVTLSKSHPANVMSAKVSFVKVGESSIFKVIPLALPGGRRLSHKYLFTSNSARYMTMERPSTSCITIDNLNVCDVVPAASVSYKCAGYLFSEFQSGKLAENCPTEPLPERLYVVDVNCPGVGKRTTVVSRDASVIHVTCSADAEKTRIKVPASSNRDIPARFRECDLRDQDDHLLHRADDVVSGNFFVRPFVPERSEIITSLDFDDDEVEDEDDEDEDDDSVPDVEEMTAEAVPRPWSSLDILTYVLSALSALFAKIIILLICIISPGCRAYFKRALCCCRNNCAICSAEEGTQHQNPNQHELDTFLDGTRSRRNSTDANESIGRLLVNAVPKLDAMARSNAVPALMGPNNPEPVASTSQAASAPEVDWLKSIVDIARHEHARQSATGRNTPNPTKK